jgi:hypothetical protein
MRDGVVVRITHAMTTIGTRTTDIAEETGRRTAISIARAS